MVIERVREIQQLVEACHYTDNTDVEAEKTEVIAELLTEVEALAKKLAEAYTKANVSVE